MSARIHLPVVTILAALQLYFPTSPARRVPVRPVSQRCVTAIQGVLFVGQPGQRQFKLSSPGLCQAVEMRSVATWRHAPSASRQSLIIACPVTRTPSPFARNAISGDPYGPCIPKYVSRRWNPKFKFERGIRSLQLITLWCCIAVSVRQ
jgi:hypothetical protein